MEKAHLVITHGKYVWGCSSLHLGPCDVSIARILPIALDGDMEQGSLPRSFAWQGNMYPLQSHKTLQLRHLDRQNTVLRVNAFNVRVKANQYTARPQRSISKTDNKSS